MAYSLDLKSKLIAKRKRGFSIKELSEEFNLSKSTVSLWVRDIDINQNAQGRLQKRRVYGQFLSIQTKKLKREKLVAYFDDLALGTLLRIDQNKDFQKLISSLFFWTEGGKHTDWFVYFTNSDPIMVATFVNLLRKSFSLTQTKFRALVHIHEYHNDDAIKKYWSEVTGIPIHQFTKSYLKPNSKKRVREGYMGCITIRYYDHLIARELRSLYNIFAKKYIGP